MRIVSLLPSATEVVFVLGLADELVGVSHECDWPVEVRTKAVLSQSTLPHGADPKVIDALVAASADGGRPTYELDYDLLSQLSPDLVLTQDLCAVCAVPAGHVNEAMDKLGCHAEVLSLDPSSIADMLDGITAVGAATATSDRAEHVVAAMRHRLEVVRSSVRGLRRPRTLALEWSDPPFKGGHWIPEMIEIAGGEPVLCNSGQPSTRVSWDEIASEHPDVVVFMPCGYDLARAAEEGTQLLDRDEIGSAAIFVTDANSYFSRPGPRLIDGIELLAQALHPELSLTTTTGIAKLR